MFSSSNSNKETEPNVNTCRRLITYDKSNILRTGLVSLYASTHSHLTKDNDLGIIKDRTLFYQNTER